MTSLSMSSRLASIEKYKFNPAAMQRLSLAALRQILNGEIDVVDATNPFVFALENSAVNSAACMQWNEANTRRQYASVAMTQEDLYLHMSDKDYIGRFATPSHAVWNFLIAKDELTRSLITDPDTGIQKITIPRNTTFTVADHTFSLQYPIDIRKLVHGGLQIVYDVTQVSPLQTLATNLIDWEERVDPDGTVFVFFSVDVYQFSIITKYNVVNAASGLKTSVAFEDEFYYARVWMQSDDGQWVEIQTTHTAQVFDPLKATAVLQVIGKTLNVTIPIIYTTTGLVRNKLRVDVYQTAGKIDLLLGNYQPDDFTTHFQYIDSNDGSAYTAAINNIKTMLIYSLSATSGGRLGLSIDELRARVINNAVGPQDLPITNVQLQAELVDDGYEIVKNVDTITNRIFLATKPMPTPTDNTLITAAASAISTTQLTFEEAEGAYGVISRLNGLTITPSAMYKTLNGITKLMTTAAYNSLTALPPTQLCLEVNAGSYSYSPFHYVLDASSDNFEVRPYYMDGPTVDSKSFVAENATTGLQVSVDATYLLERISTGYRLTLSTKSNDAYKALDDSVVFCQLSFKAGNQILPSYLLGTQLPRENPTDERVYVFDMPTTFALDAEDTLDMTAFQIGTAPIIPRCDLLQDINVLFASSAPPGVGLEYTAIDNALGRFQLPANAAGVTWERMRIRFGYPLKTLWAQGRTVLASIPYQTYPADVPRVYDKDIFDVDPVTGSAFTVVNGQLVYNYLHRIGDPVLDADGVPVLAHHKGDVVMDEFNNPVPRTDYQTRMLRLLDITTIEGVYRFANDSVAANYRNLIASSLVSWLTEDLAGLSERLLDKTKLYFYPKATQGDIRVMTGDGLEITIEAGQSLGVRLHVPASTYDNADLLDSISKSSIRTIDTAIKATTIAASAIESAMRSTYGNDVIDVKLTGLGGAGNFDVMSVLDNANRLAIKKRLVAQPDGSLIVEDAVTFDYVRHDVGTA